MGRIISVIVIVFAAAWMILSVMKNDETTSQDGQSKNMEVYIEDAQFLHTTELGEFHPDNEEGLLKIDIKVKNKTDSEMTFRPDTDVVLYDEDEQIDSSNMSTSGLNIDLYQNSSIAKGKQKSFAVLFDVSLDKTYEMNIAPTNNYGKEEIDSVTIELDVSEYKDTYTQINEPAELVQNYIETIYFQEDETMDEIEENFGIDIDDARNKAKEVIVDSLRLESSEKQEDQFFETYLQKLQDDGNIAVVIMLNTGNNARINIDYHVPSISDLQKQLSDLRYDYIEKNRGVSVKEADKEALKEIDSLVKEMKMESGSMELEMKKTKDGWDFDRSYSDPEAYIIRIFSHGY